MFLAYAVYMIARKIMAKRGFTQVSSTLGVTVIYLHSSSVYILNRLFASYYCALPGPPIRKKTEVLAFILGD
jgi:hypothetical protein